MGVVGVYTSLVSCLNSLHFLKIENEYKNRVILISPETIITSPSRLNGEEVKVHAITTGVISVKNNFLERKGTGLFAKVNILLDDQHAPFYADWGMGD